jgi:hypothetical protein
MRQYFAFFRCLSILLALNYGAFRTELFDDEYEQNHPAPSATAAVTWSSLTWETFDKNNAPEAFTFSVWAEIQLISQSPPPVVIELQSCRPEELIRDKSPPLSPSTS